MWGQPRTGTRHRSPWLEELLGCQRGLSPSLLAQGFPAAGTPSTERCRRCGGAAASPPLSGRREGSEHPRFPSRKHSRHSGGAPGRVEMGMVENVLPAVGVSIPFHPAQRRKRPGGDRGLGTPSKKKKIPPTGHNPLNDYYFFHSAMKPRIQSANGGHFEQPRAGHPHTPSQSLPGQAPISSAGES